MLAPHIHAAILGDRTVLLDIAADRYRLLRGGSACAIADLVNGRPIGDASMRAALMRAGIIDDTAGPARATLPSPPGRGVSAAAGPRHVPLLATGHALLAARIALRRHGFSHTLAQAAQRKAKSATSPNSGAACARARSFECARRLLPFGRACLPDSLALFSQLMAQSIDAVLVIGVRLDPFLAHCWVQTHQDLLTDDPDAVAAYTPILAL